MAPRLRNRYLTLPLPSHTFAVRTCLPPLHTGWITFHTVHPCVESHTRAFPTRALPTARYTRPHLYPPAWWHGGRTWTRFRYHPTHTSRYNTFTAHHTPAALTRLPILPPPPASATCPHALPIPPLPLPCLLPSIAPSPLCYHLYAGRVPLFPIAHLCPHRTYHARPSHSGTCTAGCRASLPPVTVPRYLQRCYTTLHHVPYLLLPTILGLLTSPLHTMQVHILAPTTTCHLHLLPPCYPFPMAALHSTFHALVIPAHTYSSIPYS